MEFAQQVGIGAGAVAALITAATLVITKVVIPAYRLWQLTAERTAAMAAIIEREMSNGGGMREQVQTLTDNFQQRMDDNEQLLRDVGNKVDLHVADEGVHMRREVWDEVQRDAIRTLISRTDQSVDDNEGDC